MSKTIKRCTMGIETKFIWMDGALVESGMANIPFLTAGFHYGLGVFEGIRAYKTAHGSAVFRLKDHVQRLVDSAKVLGFKSLPYSVSDLAEAVKETIMANGFEECYIRPVIYLADGGWNLNLDTGRPAIGIAVWEWKNFLGVEALEAGVRAMTSSFTRHHPNVMMTHAKITGNYANSCLAKTESVRLGFDEAIMLDPQGYVAECTGENLFLVRHGKLFTPPDAAILEGVTRDTILTLAQDLGLKVFERPIARDQLYLADEVFVTGTAAEVIALREIDHRVIGSGKAGPVTKQLQGIFHKVVRGDHPRSTDWLDYVAAPQVVSLFD